MFKTETYGKWILAGEHAVLRGCPALAFPLTARKLDLVYTDSEAPLEAYFAGEHGDEFKVLFFGVLENALKRNNISRSDLKGRMDLVSSLPVGAGLGASAALCGAIARWFEYKEWLGSTELYEFARSLEDIFHGESSGVDLAVSLSGEGIRFVRGEKSTEKTPFSVKWWPQLYLSYSGQRGITSECVNKVKALFLSQPELAQMLDEQMHQAVTLAESALQETSPTSQMRLKEAIVLARDCFERWGLCEGHLRSHMRNLEEAGCAAVKPTGSGGGGYALSMWMSPPPLNIRDKMLLLQRPKQGGNL